MFNMSTFLHPLFAGPICSGLECLPLTVGLWLVLVAPVGLALFGLISGGYYLLRRRWPRCPALLAILVPCLIIGHIAYFWYDGYQSTASYQQQQVETAQQLKFSLYQPTYIPSAFKLVHSDAAPSSPSASGGHLTFIYHDRSSQSSPDAPVTRFYAVIIQPADTTYRVLPDEGTLLATRSLNAATAFVVGAGLSPAEADKVLASLQPVTARDITFRNWSTAR